MRETGERKIHTPFQRSRELVGCLPLSLSLKDHHTFTITSGNRTLGAAHHVFDLLQCETQAPTNHSRSELFPHSNGTPLVRDSCLSCCPFLLDLLMARMHCRPSTHTSCRRCTLGLCSTSSMTDGRTSNSTPHLSKMILLVWCVHCTEKQIPKNGRPGRFPSPGSQKCKTRKNGVQTASPESCPSS